MKELFHSMFAYHHHFNQKLIDELVKHEKALPARSIPLFCHVLNAHQVWNSRLAGGTPLGVQDLHSLERCRTLDADNFKTTSALLETIQFDKVVQYTNTKGQSFSNTVRDILFHVANHTTHHRGQIISDFRQSGIQPLVTDFIFYIRDKAV